MRRLSRRHAGRLLLSLPPSLALLLAGAPPVSAGPSRVTITPTSLEGEFKFDVRGFFKVEDLSTWLTGPRGQIVRTNDYGTDDNGRVKFKLFMLRHYQPGPWAITIVGQRSLHEVIEYFETPDRGRNATVALSAASLRPGEIVSVTASGFGDEEQVSYWFTLPDGSAERGHTIVTSAKDGGVAFDFAAAGLEAGGWALSVYGYSSDSYGVATFEVTGEVTSEVTGEVIA
jgi:hypothetical protein